MNELNESHNCELLFDLELSVFRHGFVSTSEFVLLLCFSNVRCKLATRICSN